MLDAWYNSQQRKNAAGQMESFHYKWSDLSNSGYSSWDTSFRTMEPRPDPYTAPTQRQPGAGELLHHRLPRHSNKNPDPNYMTDQDAEESRHG